MLKSPELSLVILFVTSLVQTMCYMVLHKTSQTLSLYLESMYPRSLSDTYLEGIEVGLKVVTHEQTSVEKHCWNLGVPKSLSRNSRLIVPAECVLPRELREVLCQLRGLVPSTQLFLGQRHFFLSYLMITSQRRLSNRLLTSPQSSLSFFKSRGNAFKGICS